MGKNIVHCGGAGTGQVAKICNNLLLGISMIGVAEAMNLGVALGIDAKVLAGIINTSSGRCWSSDTYNPYPGVMDNVPAARGYTGGFGTDLMLKDLGLATDAAKLAKQPVAMGALAQQLYQLLSSHGAGGLDFSAIINLLNKPAAIGNPRRRAARNRGSHDRLQHRRACGPHHIEQSAGQYLHGRRSRATRPAGRRS